jgi:hypothetical protein
MEIRKITLEIGHTLEEWSVKYGENQDCWDFPIDELLDGTIEPDEDKIYWVIDGRV